MRCSPFDKSHLSKHQLRNAFPSREIPGTAGISGWFWLFWGLPEHNPSLLLDRSSPGARALAGREPCRAAPHLLLPKIRVIRWCCGGTATSIRLAMSHTHSATQPGLWNATSGRVNTDTFPSHLQEPRLLSFSRKMHPKHVQKQIVGQAMESAKTLPWWCTCKRWPKEVFLWLPFTVTPFQSHLYQNNCS